MSGPRHEGWKHTRVIPPEARGEAAAHFPHALKVLGYAEQEASRLGLLTYKHQQQLDDGTVLTGELVGGQPRMTIDVTTPILEGRRIRYRDDFVVWARDAARPDGIDAEHPQQILRPSWATFFYSADIPGYESFPGEKGTYIAMFPDGVRHAGNIEWRGRAGHRVSWYGPSTRYWLDPHVHPTEQYGKQVFMLGQVMLDVDDYIASTGQDFPEQWVMGAAMRSPAELIVVHAALVPGETDTSEAPMSSSEISAPWPSGAVSIALCRYGVARTGDAEYRVLSGTRSVLWSGALDRSLNPWFFNESGTRAVSAGFPEVVMLRRLAGATLVDPDTIEAPPPSPSNAMHTLSRDAGGAWSIASANVSLVGTSSAVVAADFAGDQIREMTVRRQVHDDLDAQFVFEAGDWSFAARAARFDLLFIGGMNRATYTGQLGAILHADLRESVFVTYRCDWFEVPNLPQANTYREAVIIWHGSAVHADIEVGSGAGAAQNPMDTGFTRQLGATRTGDRPIPRYDTVYADIPLSPMFAIYGHITSHTVAPQWDWTGAHGIYSFRPYPLSHWFGAAKTHNASVNQVLRIDADNDAGFESTRQDFDGKFAALGCASNEGVTVFSGYGYERNTGRSAQFATGGELPALTGVGGQNARYHPVWLLGRPPIE